MKELSKYQLIAESSGWVAFVLNIFPGIGTGYIYQRRWKAYWITGSLSLLWIYIGIFVDLGIDPSDPMPSRTDQWGFYGILVIAFISALEAALTVKKARREIDDMPFKT